MRVVVADTSPVNYLILIDCIGVLRSLYGSVVIPFEVAHELTAPGAPLAVATWIQSRPDWVEVRAVPRAATLSIAANLDAGEEAAICIALAEHDCLLLIDESEGRAIASRLGIPNTGTLGVLLAAAANRLVNLQAVLEKLQKTNFRISQALIDNLVASAARRGVS